MELTLTNNTVNKYLRFLSRLDDNSKKKIIKRLTESMATKEEKKIDLSLLHGAWDDSRSSDDIIKEIRDARIEKENIINFE